MNKLMHFLYYKILRPIIPHTKYIGIRNKRPATPVERKRWHILAKIILCKIFRVKRVTAGDSNDAGADKYDIMIDYDDMRTMCFGCGGSTADDWIDFLSFTKIGWWLSGIFDQKILIWNIGGNHALLNKMKGAKDSLQTLHDMFPNSYNCTIPEIKEELLPEQKLQLLGTSQETVHANMLILNDWIRETWVKRCLDLYKIYLDNITGETYDWMLRDAVHWSKFAVKCIRELKEVVT